MQKFHQQALEVIDGLLFHKIFHLTLKTQSILSLDQVLTYLMKRVKVT